MEEKREITWESSDDDDRLLEHPELLLMEARDEMKRQLKFRRKMVSEEIKFNALLEATLEKVERFLENYEMTNLIEKVL